MKKPRVRAAGGGLRGADKQQGDLTNPADAPRHLPEGLRRKRKGPVDKNVGRAPPTQRPRAPTR